MRDTSPRPHDDSILEQVRSIRLEYRLYGSALVDIPVELCFYVVATQEAGRARGLVIIASRLVSSRAAASACVIKKLV